MQRFGPIHPILISNIHIMIFEQLSSSQPFKYGKFYHKSSDKCQLVTFYYQSINHKFFLSNELNEYSALSQVALRGLSAKTGWTLVWLFRFPFCCSSWLELRDSLPCIHGIMPSASVAAETFTISLNLRTVICSTTVDTWKNSCKNSCKILLSKVW